MDVHGNDYSPEWGYCKTEGCGESAEPLWFSGGPPDDPDLLLCYKHTGEWVGRLLDLCAQAQPTVCSMLCPSVGRTVDFPLPHSPLCQAMQEAKRSYNARIAERFNLG